MRNTEIAFLADACRGKLYGNKNTIINDVRIDSRECAFGTLFVCIKGENNDGHDYVGKAYEKGCRAFLVSEEYLRPDYADAAFVAVSDTSLAFRDMAKAYLDQFKLIKVGVTGSVGKTTTKMLSAAVMSAKYKTVCTQKNYNTHLGLCMTAFLADENTEAIVFEMGMDRSNEIHEYCEWVRPDAALITCVGITHLERLGSRDKIADAKLEITHFLKEDAPLIVNCDGDYLSEKEIRERADGPYRCVLCGEKEDAKIRLSEITDFGNEGIEFKLNGIGFDLPILGIHNAHNAALAAALGLEYGISLEESAEALSKVRAYQRRLEAEKCGSIYLIDDSYNASPDSMKAALAVLASVKGKRKIAVLADMLELGTEEEKGHLEVGVCAAEKNINFLIAIGRRAAYYVKGANKTSASVNTLSFVDNASAMLCLENMLRPGDAVLVKGSNSTKVSEIAEMLREKYKKEN